MAQTTTKKYYEGLGSRKLAVARVRIFEESKPTFLINNREVTELFPDALALDRLYKPLQLTDLKTKMSVSVHVSGGGTTGWRDAIVLGIARAIIEYSAELKPILRKAGLVTRDPRAVERKKSGLKKARKSPRFSKR